MLRSALIWGRFAAFCNDLGSFCGVLQRFGVDTLGRAFLASGLRLILPLEFADSIGAALSSMSVYLLMALVLIFRPQGILPVLGRVR